MLLPCLPLTTLRAAKQPSNAISCIACADFLDPLHHEAATGRPSINLDGWMMDEQQNAAAFSRATADADVAVVEGVMGLFDGRDGASEDGSTAQMAKWLGAPVLLVLDCWALARSAAAMVKGFMVRGCCVVYAAAETCLHWQAASSCLRQRVLRLASSHGTGV